MTQLKFTRGKDSRDDRVTAASLKWKLLKPEELYLSHTIQADIV